MVLEYRISISLQLFCISFKSAIHKFLFLSYILFFPWKESIQIPPISNFSTSKFKYTLFCFQICRFFLRKTYYIRKNIVNIEKKNCQRQEKVIATGDSPTTLPMVTTNSPPNPSEVPAQIFISSCCFLKIFLTFANKINKEVPSNNG